MRPLFVCSLPRSGSTLAQKILATHSSIDTVSEPWLMLPLVYALNREGAYAEYGHRVGVKALTEFVATLPNGKADYYKATHDFAMRLYENASRSNAFYFLDKTPRYHLIIDELLDIFPEAKLVLIWRNPLAIAASIINTWGGGRWNLYRFYVDLYQGLHNLIDVAKRKPERFLQIRYEEMVENPEVSWRRVFEYIDLDFQPSALRDFNQVRFLGSMGDPTGSAKYGSVAGASVTGWEKTFRSLLRRRWAANYLDWIGEERLRFMGYSKKTLRDALQDQPAGEAKMLLSDLRLMSVGLLHAPFNLATVKQNLIVSRSGGKANATY